MADEGEAIRFGLTSVKGVGRLAADAVVNSREGSAYSSIFDLASRVDTRIVGFVAWRDRGEWCGSGYLSWLYVDPEFHRRGIGNQLMTEAMAALGPQAWTLVRLGNDPAISLYKEHGMEIVLSRPPEVTGYPHTELRMALPTSRKFDSNVPNFGA